MAKTIDELEKELDESRKANEAARKEIKELKTSKTDSDKKLSEIDEAVKKKTQAEATTLEAKEKVIASQDAELAKLREDVKKQKDDNLTAKKSAAFTHTLSKFKISEATLLKLFPIYKDSIAVKDDGSLENQDAIEKQLRADVPALFSASQTPPDKQPGFSSDTKLIDTSKMTGIEKAKADAVNEMRTLKGQGTS